MLDRCNNALTLHGLRRQSTAISLQYGICAEAFPDAPAARFASDRTDHWPKMDVDAFTTEFFTESDSTRVHERLVPGCTNCNTWWERRNVLRFADAKGTVLKTQI